MNNISNLAIFLSAYKYIDEMLTSFATSALTGVSYIVGPSLTILVTIWLMFEGYHIINGQSREPFTAFIWKAAKVVLIVTVVHFIIDKPDQIMQWVNVNIKNNVASAVLYSAGGTSDPMKGLEKTSPEGVIASALTIMHLLMNMFASLQTNGGDLSADPSKFVMLGGIGVGTPAVIGTAMLLFNKAALSICLLLSPIFILCLIFDSTKSMFQSWLKFLLGTILTLVILTAMVVICLKAVIYYATTVMTTYTADSVIGNITAAMGAAGSTRPPLAQTSLIQGGLGLLMSTLIVAVPPMASQILGGMLGSFAAYSPFGGGASPMARDPSGSPVSNSYSNQNNSRGNADDNEVSQINQSPNIINSPGKVTLSRNSDEGPASKNPSSTSNVAAHKAPSASSVDYTNSHLANRNGVNYQNQYQASLQSRDNIHHNNTGQMNNTTTAAANMNKTNTTREDNNINLSERSYTQANKWVS